MMNTSELMTAIKMDLGIYGLSLPIVDENKAFMEVIKLRTIKTFSQYVPYVLRVELDLDDLKPAGEINYQESTYELPNIFGDRRLLGIRKITPRNKLMGSNYVNPMFDDTYDSYLGLMQAQANANLFSMASPSFSFRFQHPNIIRLFNTSSLATQLVFEFQLEHSENLATIPNSSWESFYELAIIDIKQMLYGILKHYNDLQTALGTVSLKIDDWANAASERKELIERWKDVFHLDSDQFVII